MNKLLMTVPRTWYLKYSNRKLEERTEIELNGR